MKATDLFLAGYRLAMASDQELHKKWISISFKLGSIAGTVHTINLQRIGRLDMMLRLFEKDRLEAMNRGATDEVDISLDVQFAFSESWLLFAYEVARSAKEQLKRRDEELPRLLTLEHRLAVVRMPVAKGQIQGMNLRANRDNPPLLTRAGDVEPEPYEPDGSYIMSYRLCEETGAVLWCPVDMTTRQNVAICRRDLSDEMLALFD